MKRLIYISGISSTNLLLLGSLFKLNYWPASNIFLVLSIILFCVVFLPLSLIASYREQKGYKWLHIVTFIVFAISMLAGIFKIMHWPGAAVLLTIGIPLPFILFLPVYLYSTRKIKNQRPTNSLGIMFGLIFIAVFSVLLTLSARSGHLDSLTMNGNEPERGIEIQSF